MFLPFTETVKMSCMQQFCIRSRTASRKGAICEILPSSLLSKSRGSQPSLYAMTPCFWLRSMGLSNREVAYCFGEGGNGAVGVGLGVSSVEERWMPSSSSSGSIVGRAGGFVEGSDILNEKERENDGNRYGKTESSY